MTVEYKGHTISATGDTNWGGIELNTHKELIDANAQLTSLMERVSAKVDLSKSIMCSGSIVSEANKYFTFGIYSVSSFYYISASSLDNSSLAVFTINGNVGVCSNNCLTFDTASWLWAGTTWNSNAPDVYFTASGLLAGYKMKPLLKSPDPLNISYVQIVTKL